VGHNFLGTIWRCGALLQKIGGIWGVILAVLIPALGLTASAADVSDAELGAVQHQINTIKHEESVERRRVEQDEQLIRRLEQQLEQLQTEHASLSHQADVLTVTSQKLKADTAQIEDLQKQIAAAPTDEQFGSAMTRWLGSHQFTWNGAVAGDFIYDRGNNTNTFALTFEPLVIYRLNDWISFVGEVEAALPQGSSAEFQLPIAMFQLFLNDYLQVNAGIFDQPFGDWYEAQSPLWVNRFVTAPLLYGAEAIIPPTEIGFQLRGGLQWGSLGQDLDYTSWIGNGPGFSTQPQPVVGQTLNPVNNIQTNTNGKAFGTRIRFYPFPLDSNLGRLELGASTYNGKWLNGSWFNSWGIDYAYLNGNLQTRGEYVQTYRQMPAGSPGGSPDKRQGWYVQFGYFLQGLPLPQLPFGIDRYIQNLEPLVRYSGVNQRAVVADEISTVPELGFTGSPAIFTPHAREVALGMDYWIEPSIVWQTEFDIELPRAGGTLFSFNGASTAMASPIGATSNDHAILTQLAIGF
jgi:TolA-binding protein